MTREARTRKAVLAFLAPLVCGCLGVLTGCKALYTRTFRANPLPRTRGLAAETVPEVLALPEEEIDIGRAALLVARGDRKDLDVDAYLRRLNEMAARLRRRLPEGTGVGEAVRQTVAVVQPRNQPRNQPGNRAGKSSMRGRRRARGRASHASVPTSELPEKGLPPEIDLARILDGGPGNCLGLTLLYLAVGERVGLPLYGVSAPEHFFVRYDDGVTRTNIEPMRDGRILPDRAYVRSAHSARVSRESIDHGIHLRSESKRQVIASLLANRAGYRAMQGRLEEAYCDALRALAVKPYWPQGYVNRGLIHELAGRTRQAEADYHEHALKLDPNCVGALNNLAALYARGRAVGVRPDEAGEPGKPEASGGLTSGAGPDLRDERPSGAGPDLRDERPSGAGPDLRDERPSGAGPDLRDERPSGTPDTAEWLIRRAMKLAPTRPELYETAAAVAVARGRLKEARARLQRAKVLAPDDERYVRALHALDRREYGPAGPAGHAD